MPLIDIIETGQAAAPNAPQTTFTPGLASDVRSIKPRVPGGLRSPITIRNGNSRALNFIITATIIDFVSGLVETTPTLQPIQTKDQRTRSINCIEACEGFIESWQLTFDLAGVIQDRAIKYDGKARRFLITHDSRRNPKGRSGPKPSPKPKRRNSR